MCTPMPRFFSHRWIDAPTYRPLHRNTRPSIFTAEFWGKEDKRNRGEPVDRDPLDEDHNRIGFAKSASGGMTARDRAGREGASSPTPSYSTQEIVKALIYLKDQLEYETAAREQAEKERRIMEERLEKMEGEMRSFRESMNTRMHSVLQEELSIREHDNTKNWPISYKYLHTIISEEIKKAETAHKRHSLKVEDDLVAELLPQLVAEEVRLLEAEIKKVHDTQISLINSTLADLKRKMEDLTSQNYQFLTDIATIKAHPKIRSKKEKKKKDRQDKRSSKDSSQKSGTSSDGQSRDSGRDIESIGDEDEAMTVEEKRKSKKGLKLAVLLNRDKEPKKEKEKVNAYATVRVRAPPSGQFQVPDVFDDSPAVTLQTSSSSPSLLSVSDSIAPNGITAPDSPHLPMHLPSSPTSAPSSPVLAPVSVTPTSNSLGITSGTNFLNSLSDSPSKVSETRAKVVKDTFSELYGGNYQTLREWQMAKLRGLHSTSPVSSKQEGPINPGDSGPRIRQFATIRYHPRRFTEEDCGKIEESLFAAEIITELSVRFVGQTCQFLKRCCLLDPPLQKDLFSYSPEECENKILELKTKLEIQPNYEFTAQYDDPRAVAALLILFLKNLPKPILDKQAQPFLVSAEIENVAYRQSVLRSLFYTLPNMNQTMLLTLVQLSHSLVYNVDDELPTTPTAASVSSDLNDSSDSFTQPEDMPNTHMGTLTRTNAKAIPIIPLAPIEETTEAPVSVKGKKSKSSTNLDQTKKTKKRTATTTTPPEPSTPPLSVSLPTSSSSNSLAAAAAPKSPNGTIIAKPVAMQSVKSSPNANRPLPLPSPTTSLRSLATSASFTPTDRAKRHTKSLSTNTIGSVLETNSPSLVRSLPTSPMNSSTGLNPSTPATPSTPSTPSTSTPATPTSPVLTSSGSNKILKTSNGISLTRSMPSSSSLTSSAPNSPVTNRLSLASSIGPLSSSGTLLSPHSTAPVPPPLPPTQENDEDSPTKGDRLSLSIPTKGEPESEEERLAMFSNAFAPILSVTKTVDPDAVHLFDVLVKDYNPIFLQDIKGIEFVIRNGLTIVKAASLDRLVEKLMDPFYKDPEFSDIMFLCYNYFMEASTLLDILVGYYNTTLAPEVKPWQSQLAVRVLVIIKMWIMRHTDSLQENLPFMEKLNNFIETAPNRAQEASFFKFFRTFHQQASPLPVVLKRGLSFAPHILGDARPSIKFFSLHKKTFKGVHDFHHFEFLETPASPYGLHKKDGNVAPMVDLGAVECSTMAIQLTLVDHELLRAIKPTEFLHKNFTRLASSPNFNCMVNKFNEWGMWACSVVLAHEKLADRVSIIAYFIELAKCCVEINNFNAGCALIGGLNHSSISRLKLSWEKVPSKSMQDYDKLLTLFDMSHNYKNYREALKSCKPPAIPYLGLFPKDLIAVEEGNENRTPAGLINFEKFRLLSKQVKKIEAFQHPLFSAKIIPKINAYLKTLKLFTEKELYEKSLLYEPRK